MSIAGRFDGVLMTMAGQAGSLPALLQIFFSFLHRQSDFYVTFDPSKTARSSMGFPPGTAEKLLLHAFRSFPFKPCDDTDKKAGSLKPPRQVAGHRAAGSGAAKHLADSENDRGSGTKGTRPTTASTANETITQNDNINTNNKGQTAASEDRDAEATPPRTSPTMPADTAGENTDSRPAPPSPQTVATTARSAGLDGESTNRKFAPSSSVAASVTGAAEPMGGIRVRYSEDGKQIPIGNGGVTPRYYWTQTITEATVYVDVPEGTRSKDVTCSIEPRRLRLEVRGAGDIADKSTTRENTGGREEKEKHVIIDGELPTAVSRDDSMWSLNDGKTVVIFLEKSKRSWWESVVKGDPEIDTTKVDSTTKIGEFDEETQGTIRKIMFDQRQKALGLPSSDQLSVESVLERARSLPGSPFLPGGLMFDGGVSENENIGTATVDIGPDGGLRDTVSPEPSSR